MLVPDHQSRLADRSPLPPPLQHIRTPASLTPYSPLPSPFHISSYLCHHVVDESVLIPNPSGLILGPEAGFVLPRKHAHKPAPLKQAQLDMWT